MTTPSKATEKLRDYLDVEARSLGFDQVGVTSAKADPVWGDRLKHYVSADHHGSMEWIAETIARRVDPQVLWTEAQNIIVLSMNYGPESNPLDILESPDHAAISCYAKHRDYHDVIKGRLKTLAAGLLARAKKLGQSGDVKVFVDTAPVMEKPLAARAGLGWQGKHTNLVSRDHGSWLFLGSIFTTLDFVTDEREVDHCGSCRSCLDICPTNAFPAPYQIDARRCISYLTIENKGPIPNEFRKAMGNRIFGCDDCLAVCPWNKFASVASEVKFQLPAGREPPMLADLLQLDDASFRKRFSGSPVKRIGRNRFLRNVLIAAGNSKTPELVPLIERHLADADPLVRGATVWALGQLQAEADECYAGAKAKETDETVLDEWRKMGATAT